MIHDIEGLSNIRPAPQFSGHVKAKFIIVIIGIFGKFWYQYMGKISKITWIGDINFWNWNLYPHKRENSTFVKKKFHKMTEISDLNRAQNITNDYVQNLKQDPLIAKIKIFGKISAWIMAFLTIY